MLRGTPYLFPVGARLGEQNLVLHAIARRHSVEQCATPTSIKTVLRGRVCWTVGGRHLVVDPSSFLILATGEHYSMNIDEASPIETCCAFFGGGFVEKIAMDLTSTAESALDTPDRVAPPVPYLSALHGDHERALTDRVRSLAAHCENALRPSGLEEAFLMLGSSLLGYYEQIRSESAKVPAMREATRQEFFRRLLIGREYIHARSSEPVSLAAIADAACLSPFHFHRGFKRTFQETPHSYLTGLRLAQAREMLEGGSTVLEACLAVGFSSPSAFCRLFRSRLGYAPSAVRRKFARSGKN